MSAAQGGRTFGPRTLLGWLAAIVLAAALGIGVQRLLHPPPEVPPPVRVRQVQLPADLPRNWPDTLARTDRDIADAAALAARFPGEWLRWEVLARNQVARARLTGAFEDYAAAQASLDRAFQVAPAGAGPHGLQASLHFTMHRLAAAERMLAAIDRYGVPPDLPERIDNLALRGDIAFYRGDYAAARKLYDQVDRMEPGGAGDFRRAVYAMNTGRPDLADRWLDRWFQASRMPTPKFVADIELQKGVIDLKRGAWDAALVHFRAADAAFPGYWLTQAYLAQTLAVTGRPDEAERLYAAIVQRAEIPEVLDALAGLARRRGDAPAARAWAARAAAVWARRLALFPEAAYGHAAEHELAFGSPARALEFALKDHAARPYGQTAVALAFAYLANNRPKDALAALEPVRGSRWVSAEQHLAAAQAYALTGDAARADAEQRAALKLNPRAADPGATLIWFGH